MPRRSSRRPLRAHLPGAPKPEELFRWRGTGVSRVEGLADAVFAFTVTLLVVALEVPRDYEGLFRVFAGFPAFAATFAILMWFWSVHYLFFRRYGLEDTLTRFLNILVLLFVVFLAYPLKFMFASAFGALLGIGDGVVGIDSLEQLANIYIIYGGGLGLIWLFFALLHWHAYRMRERLRLTASEVVLTLGSLRANLINIVICISSILLASTQRFDWQPGALYALCGPTMAFNGWWHGMRAARARPAPRQSAVSA